MDDLTKMSVRELCWKFGDHRQSALTSWISRTPKEAAARAYELGERCNAIIAELERRIAENKPKLEPDQILMADGRVVRVLGELPMTADGCVATINGTFFTPPDALTPEDDCCGMAAWADGNAPVGKRKGFPVSYIGSDRTWNSDECYSTREAAEADAKKEGK